MQEWRTVQQAWCVVHRGYFSRMHAAAYRCRRAVFRSRCRRTDNISSRSRPEREEGSRRRRQRTGRWNLGPPSCPGPVSPDPRRTRLQRDRSKGNAGQSPRHAAFDRHSVMIVPLNGCLLCIFGEGWTITYWNEMLGMYKATRRRSMVPTYGSTGVALRSSCRCPGTLAQWAGTAGSPGCRSSWR